MIGIHAHERGKIKGNGEPRLTLREEVVKTLIGIFSGAKPAELADGPKPSPVHGRVDAARVRRLTGKAQVSFVIEVFQVGRRIETLDGTSRDAGELLLALRRFPQQGIESFLLPLSLQFVPMARGGRNLTHACSPASIQWLTLLSSRRPTFLEY